MSAKIGSVKAKLRPVVEGAPPVWHITSAKANLLTPQLPAKNLFQHVLRRDAAQDGSHGAAVLARLPRSLGGGHRLNSGALLDLGGLVAHQAFGKRYDRTWAAYVISLLTRPLVVPGVAKSKTMQTVLAKGPAFTKTLSVAMRPAKAGKFLTPQLMLSQLCVIRCVWQCLDAKL